MPFAAWAAERAVGVQTIPGLELLARCDSPTPDSESKGEAGRDEAVDDEELGQQGDRGCVALADENTALRIRGRRSERIRCQRQLLQNTIDLDARARTDEMPGPSHRLPTLVFWGIATAFPSLSHKWLWIFFESTQLSLGFTNVVRSLYKKRAANARWDA